MRKGFWLLSLGLLLASSGLPGTEDLRAGEAAIFFRNGDMIIDEIVDISSARHVLELKRSPEIPLNNLWMINFINTEWYHPKELDLLETNQHYVFLKNGDVSSGRIVDFSVNFHHFEFETGEKFPIGQVRRIYFTRNVPERYEREIEKILIREGVIKRRIRR